MLTGIYLFRFVALDKKVHLGKVTFDAVNACIFVIQAFIALLPCFRHTLLALSVPTLGEE